MEHRLAKRQRRLRDLKEQNAPSALKIQTLQKEVDHLYAAQADFRQHLIQLSLGLHPFDVEAQSAQTTQQVSLKDAAGSVDKFNRQIEEL